MRFFRGILISLTAATLSLTGLAQSGEEIIKRFDQRFVELDSLIYGIPSSQSAEALYPLGISRTVIYDSLYRAAVSEHVDRQQRVVRAETGIQATGQVYSRLDNAFKLGDDDEPMSNYRAKAQAELRWYFLQSSLFKRSGRENEYKIKGEIEVLAHEKERIDLTIYRQKELLRWRSDSLIAGMLAHRVNNLTMLEDANLYLLSNENISSEDLLRIIDDKAKAERQLAMMSSVFPAATTLALPYIEWDIIEVDTARLIQHIEESQIDLHLLELRAQLLDQQASNESWWRSARIAPFVRYSGYYTVSNNINSNIDAGVSFTIPINQESKRTRQAIAAQKAVVEAQAIDIKLQVRDKVAYLAQEIARLNRASAAEAKRVESLKQYLVMRGTAYENRQGEYSRLMRMKEYNSYISSIEQLLTYQQQRDNYIADLQAFLADCSILDFCRFSSLHEAEASSP